MCLSCRHWNACKIEKKFIPCSEKLLFARRNIYSIAFIFECVFLIWLLTPVLSLPLYARPVYDVCTFKMFCASVEMIGGICINTSWDLSPKLSFLQSTSFKWCVLLWIEQSLTKPGFATALLFYEWLVSLVSITFFQNWMLSSFNCLSKISSNEMTFQRLLAGSSTAWPQ